MKKPSYKERKKPSRPSGSVPPAPLASSRAETPSGASQPGTSSSSLSRPSGGQGKREGSQGAPGVVSRGASSPPAGSRSSERGGSVSGLSSVVSERAPASPAPSGAGEGGVARSQRTSLACSASSVFFPHSSPHARRRGELRERLRRTAPVCYPLVVPDLRIEEHGRIRELVHGRVVLVTVAVVLALAPLPVRGQEVESVEGGHCHGRSLPVCVRIAISRGLLTATVETATRSRRVRSHSRGDRSRSSDRYRSRRDRSRSSDRYRSHRQRTRSPARRGGRGHAIDDLAPVTARSLGRKDG